jgi:hypothetical protein
MVVSFDAKEGAAMPISSQGLPVARRWAHKLYLVMASLILIGIVIEGVLIGPSLFTATRWGQAVHGDLGVVLLLLTLLLPVAGRLARLRGRVILLSAVLFVLALLEVTSAALGRRTSLLAALHPANALLMGALTVFLLMHRWQLMRESGSEMKTQGGPHS